MKARPALPVLFLFVCVVLSARDMNFGTRNQPSFGELRHHGTEVIQARDASQDIRLAPLTHAGDPHNVLYLDFDDDLSVQLHDAAGNYRIAGAEYIPSRQARIGSGAALFQEASHRILVASPDELWPGQGILGDFTMEFWMKPLHFHRQSRVFRKTGMVSGRKRGLEVLLDEAVPRVVFWNLFEDTQGISHTIELAGRAGVVRGEWTHIVLSYQAGTGRIALFRDGREERTVYARSKRELWHASFHDLDRSPITLADNYLGLLDDFRITDRSVMTPLDVDPWPYKKTGRDNTGVVTSAVTSYGPQTGGWVVFQAAQPPGTSVEVLVRTADQPFTSQSSLPGWKRVTGKMELPAFRYLQWKSELRPDPEGRVSPVLENVEITTIPAVVPSPPGSLRVVLELSQDREVVLEWVRSPETTVRERGGYALYFGEKPGDYHGHVRLPAASAKPALELLTKEEAAERETRRAAVDRRLSGLVRVRVTNQLIERAMAADRRVQMPLLRLYTPMYFAIAAYSDSDRLESGLSREVFVVPRPSGN